ncbi:MAG: hypothetical protein WCU90_02370, partial [Kiritimatiellia bacterium]
ASTPPASKSNWYDKPFKKHLKRREQDGDRPAGTPDDRERPPRDDGARGDRPARPSQPRPGDEHKPRSAGYKGGSFKGGRAGGGGFKSAGGFKGGGGFKKGPKPPHRSSRPPQSKDR